MCIAGQRGRSCRTGARTSISSYPELAWVAIAIVTVSGAGCATTAPLRQDPCSGQITRAELLQVGAGSSAWEAIRSLRPSFLRSRAPATPANGGRPTPIVVVDNLQPEDLSQLRLIPTADILSVQHLSGPEATTRYGTGAVGGAIVVTTLGGPPADRVKAGCNSERTVEG